MRTRCEPSALCPVSYPQGTLGSGFWERLWLWLYCRALTGPQLAHTWHATTNSAQLSLAGCDRYEMDFAAQINMSSTGENIPAAAMAGLAETSLEVHS